MTMRPMMDGSNPDMALPGLASLLATIQRLYPQARVTSGYRGPNNPLTLANPHSMHAQGSSHDPRAVDVAPIPGVAFGDYVNAIKHAGVPVAQAFDEAKHPYPWTTGPNWHLASGGSQPHRGHQVMPTPQQGQSLYPYDPYYTQGRDPLAPEPPTQPVPMPGPGMSAPAVASSPVASHKRGGILGALESVFMPNPDSRWAGALRDGLFNAKESQQKYKEGEFKTQLETMMTQAKLKTYLTKGEYQVVGNNVFHTKPDGNTEWLTAPDTPDKTQRLIDAWKGAGDPQTKDLIYRILLGANAPEVLAAKGANADRTAHIRAGATIGAARIRGPSGASSAAKPPSGFILDQ